MIGINQSKQRDNQAIMQYIMPKIVILYGEFAV